MDIARGYYDQAVYGSNIKDQKIARLEKEIERLMDCLEKTNQMLIECGEEPLTWFQGKPFRPSTKRE